MKQEERIHGVFIFILLVLFIAYEEILRVIPQFIKKELFESIKLSPDSLGLMGTFALYVYLILQIPIGYIYDRITMRLVIPLVVFICALGAFFFGWSYNLFFATFAKGLMSFSLPFAFIGSMMVILRWFPHQRFALLVGTAQLIGALGILIAGVPIEMLLKYYTSWRVVMIMLGCVGVVLALMCLMIVKDGPEEIFIIPHRHQYFKQIKMIFTSSQSWYLALNAFCGWGPMVVFAGTWGGPYLQKKYAISVDSAAGMMTFCWLGLGIISPLIGWYSDRIGRRIPLLYSTAALGILSSLLLLFTPGQSLILASIFLFFLGVAAGGQILTFPLIKELTFASSGGVALGFINGAAVLGGIVSQAIAGGILKLFPALGNLYSLTAYRIAFLIVPLSFIVAFVTSFFYIQETFCKEQEKTRV